MKKHLINILLPVLLFCSMVVSGCKKTSDSTGTPSTPVIPPVITPATADIDSWITTGDRLQLLKKQTTALGFGTAANGYVNLTVDSTLTYQTIDGFGFTLTQGSAYVISQLSSAERTALLTELFGNTDNSIGVSYLRVGIGATDLSSTLYTYDDLPAGTTDVNMQQFSLAPDQAFMIPVLKEILAINPGVKILGSPWSAPVWMKDNGNFKGGSLLPAYYAAYAAYFVKYIQAMAAEGITINAITPQNEPLNPDNTPSMYMTATAQANFIKSALGLAFAANNITTKIITYDHNADQAVYPITVLSDPDASQYVDGSAFHLYAGDISALSTVHNSFPNKNIYFTEQYTASTGGFAGDLTWHLKNVMIGSVRNWSKVALEWNLANDPQLGPHTNGGCTTCLGGLTISPGSITRNVGYYIVAQMAKFVPAGSVRISSTDEGTLSSAAFLRPDGKKVLVVVNYGESAQTFNLKYKNRWATASLPSSSGGTYVW